MIREIMLMVMMTGGGDGPVDASFIEVGTMAECEQRAANAIAVFPRAGITYVRHHCLMSKIKFDDFLHNSEPTGPKYIFDLEISPDGKNLRTVRSFISLKECREAGGGNCVIAYQNTRK